MTTPSDVDVLLLGSGWTGTFLCPLLDREGVRCATTTRDGNEGSVAFTFDPESNDPMPFKALPRARTIVIIFPVKVDGGYEKLLRLYRETHPDARPRWIQLGSTGSYDGGPTSVPSDEKKRSMYIDRNSPVNLTNDRTKCEKELLDLHSSENATTVLHLCGLWGGPRSMRRYVGRLAGTKEQLGNKGSIHMIHGIDVARSILAVHRVDNKFYGQRWIVTDMRVYDWWDLASKWGDAGEVGRGKPMTGPQAQWVTDLMIERNIKSLPRTVEELGRGMTSLDFWQHIGISPVMGGLLD